VYLNFLADLGLTMMLGFVDIIGEESYVVSLLRPRRA